MIIARGSRGSPNLDGNFISDRLKISWKRNKGKSESPPFTVRRVHVGLTLNGMGWSKENESQARKRRQGLSGLMTSRFPCSQLFKKMSCTREILINDVDRPNLLILLSSAPIYKYEIAYVIPPWMKTRFKCRTPFSLSFSVSQLCHYTSTLFLRWQCWHNILKIDSLYGLTILDNMDWWGNDWNKLYIISKGVQKFFVLLLVSKISQTDTSDCILYIFQCFFLLYIYQPFCKIQFLPVLLQFPTINIWFYWDFFLRDFSFWTRGTIILR